MENGCVAKAIEETLYCASANEYVNTLICLI